MPQERKSGRARHEQILEAAFELAHTNHGWSLAEVAERIGISKTAIYRHFKNRAEIENAMEDTFRTDMLTALERSDGTAEGLRRATVAFFRNNSGYLYLFMTNLFTRCAYDLEIGEWLKTASPHIAGLFARAEKLSTDEKDRFEAEILKNCVSILIASFRLTSFGQLQEDLLTLLRDGIPECRIPSAKRYEECEKEALIEAGELESSDRLFSAIAAVIHEHGLTKTTIERIADKMGMAKSSLYFFSRNKETMLAELVKKEIETMVTLCLKRVPAGKTFAEQLFIVMAVQANYLLMNPELFAVFNWIRYETMRVTHDSAYHDIETESFLGLFLLDEIFANDPDARIKTIAVIKLAATLSTSVVLQSRRRGDDTKKTLKNIRIMHESILRGDKEIK